MEHYELEAREAIRDLVARYNASGDSGRIDEMLVLFSEDAVVEVVPDEVYRGHEAIRSLFSGAVSGDVRVLRHFTATHQIDVEGPEWARGRSYYAVLTEDGLDHWGRYVDVYRCSGGLWRFAHRRITMDAAVPGGWAERRLARVRGAG